MATKKTTPSKSGTARNTKQTEPSPAAPAALAELLAAVLSHPDLPDCLEETIGEGLNDVFNNLPNRSWKRIEYSPEYISLLLSTHKKGGAGG
jgi:hypothetical protein